MIKRVLGIVLATCILATMCVGLSITGLAAEAKDVAYATVPVVKSDAKNYVDLTKATVTGTASINGNTLSFTNGADTNKIDIPLDGLTADDDYIVSFTTAIQGDWEPVNFRFAQSADGANYQGFTLRGKGSKYNEYVTEEGIEGLITRYKALLGIPEDDATTLNSNNFRAWPTENKVAARFDIIVTKSAETGSRRVLLFQDGVPAVCKKTEVGFDLKYEAYVQPRLVFSGWSGKEATNEITDLKVYKLSDTEGYVEVTTTTGNGVTTTTTKKTTTTTTRKPTTTGAVKDVEFPTSPVPNKDAKNYADIEKATFTGSAERLENGNVKNAGEDPNNGRTHGDVTIPLTGLKNTDSYVISFATTINPYDVWQICKVRVGQSKDGKKFQQFDLRGAQPNNMQANPAAFHELYTEIGNEKRAKAEGTTIDTYRMYSHPDALKGQLTRYEIVMTFSAETGKRRIILFQNGERLLSCDTKEAWESKNEEKLDPCLVFVGQTAKTGSFEIQNLKVYKLSETKNYANVNLGGSTSSGGATTGNASRAIGALAITACVALPVIFATKKRKA